MDLNEGITVYKGRLLLKNGNTRLIYRSGVLLLRKNEMELKYDLSQYCTGIKKIGIRLRMLDRLMRLEPRCACMVDGDYLISWQGRVLNLKKDGTLIVEHAYRSGMNNPLSFTKVSAVEGFDDGILYGEYFGNLDRVPVSIWHRNTQGQWKKVYEFPSGTIQHIHGIVTDPLNGRVLVLTGDKDRESNIWEFRNHFKKCRIIAGGSQIYRSCVAFMKGDDLLYATDTPLEQNYVCVLKKGTSDPEPLMPLQGSCIYGSACVSEAGKKLFVFITAVEPDASMNGWRYRLTSRLGKGIHDRYSYINILSESGESTVLFKAKKDIWPLWLFQFGNFRIAETDIGLAVTGQALKKYDGRTVEFTL